MINGYYESNVGSIALINKNGGYFCISNRYGDGTFAYSVMTQEEFDDGVAKGDISPKWEYADAWLDDGKDWKVMDDDCSTAYTDSGVELKPGYCLICRVGTTFIFVQRQEEAQ